MFPEVFWGRSFYGGIYWGPLPPEYATVDAEALPYEAEAYEETYEADVVVEPMP